MGKFIRESIEYSDREDEVLVRATTTELLNIILAEPEEHETADEEEFLRNQLRVAGEAIDGLMEEYSLSLAKKVTQEIINSLGVTAGLGVDSQATEEQIKFFQRKLTQLNSQTSSF